jgi:UDP-2-acetamido-2,6-beta-L-arabino-hexul-4-ose reductase
MIRIAITGAGGFIGHHLCHYLRLWPQEFEVIPVFRKDWESRADLQEKLRGADSVVHLAALNRDPDPDRLIRVNGEMTRSLTEALNETSSKPYIIYASSSQEGNGTAYGRMKEKTRRHLAAWAAETGAPFRGMIIPNVFGPFGKPFYHSVVATFCYQLWREESPVVIEDKEINFISILSLCRIIAEAIRQRLDVLADLIPEDKWIKVSTLLSLLRHFDARYRMHNEIPALQDAFEVDLFNTYRSFLPMERLPVFLSAHRDERGSLAEILRTSTAGQVFFSATLPGITRGNHFHLRKIERFCVLRGEAVIRLRRIGSEEVIEIPVSGEKPAVVDMPVWFTHSISNTGSSELLTLFWSNEFYDPRDSDTWFALVSDQ